MSSDAGTLAQRHYVPCCSGNPNHWLPIQRGGPSVAEFGQGDRGDRLGERAVRSRVICRKELERRFTSGLGHSGNIPDIDVREVGQRREGRGIGGLEDVTDGGFGERIRRRICKMDRSGLLIRSTTICGTAVPAVETRARRPCHRGFGMYAKEESRIQASGNGHLGDGDGGAAVAAIVGGENDT